MSKNIGLKTRPVIASFQLICLPIDMICLRTDRLVRCVLVYPRKTADLTSKQWQTNWHKKAFISYKRLTTIITIYTFEQNKTEQNSVLSKIITLKKTIQKRTDWVHT